jgi:hypothetical protein
LDGRRFGEQMITSPIKLDALRQKILEAFPKIDPPGPENITSHPCKECDGVRNDFRGVHWWAAGDALIDENFDNLALFTPEAYHYFLPAFLLRALNAFDPDNLVLQFCIYSLSPTKTPIDDPWYRARLNQFTPAQSSVIVKFLECVLEDEGFNNHHRDAERGLRKFWHVAKNEAAI